VRILDLILEAQGNLCFHCDKPMMPPGMEAPRGKQRNREHVYPRARHRWLVNNQVWAHERCNTLRGSKPPTAAMIAKAKALYAVLGLTAFLNTRADKAGYAKEQAKMRALLERRP
jgi:hypothetical protein